jgi:pantoate--beta-alanine ligase
LEIVQPHTAFFGRKDAQQARILTQMARDLNLDTEISVQPIVREPDYVAYSSRNAYLTIEEREAARSLSRALLSAASAITAGERNAGAIVEAARRVLVEEPLVKIDYVELVNEENLQPVTLLGQACLLLIAATVGNPQGTKQPTRLIDNMLVTQDATGKFQTTL